jgi:hypothetical protein
MILSKQPQAKIHLKKQNITDIVRQMNIFQSTIHQFFLDKYLTNIDNEYLGRFDFHQWNYATYITRVNG